MKDFVVNNLCDMASSSIGAVGGVLLGVLLLSPQALLDVLVVGQGGAEIAGDALRIKLRESLRVVVPGRRGRNMGKTAGNRSRNAGSRRGSTGSRRHASFRFGIGGTRAGRISRTSRGRPIRYGRCTGIPFLAQAVRENGAEMQGEALGRSG